eukprot:TRINITY_DN26306_c0_g1_i2.p1 TRINITY_DN26306_c0_g1~~TRINITY_DN26306_c0_g1_i2.p1  ORF type:complete len:458 (-),score=93.60 TRINITY_DN26306_c0_g1_i2:25-1308(-)
MERWLCGVLASVLASFGTTLGGQFRIASLAIDEKRSACLLQCLGWAFFFAGQLTGQVAIVLAPATVVACVTFSGGLLWNAILAPLVLGERLTAGHWLGVALLSVGGTAVTLTAGRSQGETSWLSMAGLFLRPPFPFVAAAAAGLAVLVGIRAARVRSLDLFGFAYLFALVGASDLLAAKFALQLLGNCAFGGADSAAAPVAPATAVVTAVLFMLALHGGVFLMTVWSTYYRQALLSVPLFLGSGAMLQVVLCGTFFGEFVEFGVSRGCVFFASFALMLAGMVVTSRANQPTTSQLSKEQSAELNGDGAQDDIVVMNEEPPRLASKALQPLISGGVLDRKATSLSAQDLLMLVDIQRSALIFGGRPAPIGVQRRGLTRQLGSAPVLGRPLLRGAASGSCEDTRRKSDPITTLGSTASSPDLHSLARSK